MPLKGSNNETIGDATTQLFFPLPNQNHAQEGQENTCNIVEYG